MEIVLKKQPQKYLASVDAKTRKKLNRALNGLMELEGDIVKLAGKKDLYRLKLNITALFSPILAVKLSLWRR